MEDIDTPIETLRERLTQLLADWGAEMSMVLKDLEDARARVNDLEENSTGKAELAELRKRLKGQDDLLETLKGDAAESAKLRKSLHASELESEKLRSDLESKRDLVKALRNDLEKAAELKKELKRKDRETTALAAAKDELDQHVAELEQRVAAAEKSAQDSHDDTSELVAIRAELDAKTSLIKSLRTDAQRSESLEERLHEKQATIVKLEASLESQAATIADLKESVKRWKEKASELTASDLTGDTSISTRPDLKASTATVEVEALDEAAATITDEEGERTLAINMRDSLRQARDTIDKNKKGKAAER